MSVHDGTYPVSDPFHPAHVPFHTTKVGDLIRGCINALPVQGMPLTPETVGEPAALSLAVFEVVAVEADRVAVGYDDPAAEPSWLRSWVRVKEEAKP